MAAFTARSWQEVKFAVSRKGLQVPPCKYKSVLFHAFKLQETLCLGHGQTAPGGHNIQPPPALAQPWSANGRSRVNDASCIFHPAYFVFCIHSSRRSTVAMGPRPQPDRI